MDHGAQFEGLSRSLTSLAQYSALRSEEEDTRGGTCGDNSPTGRGPRARGRAQDANIFADYRVQMDELLAAEQLSLAALSEEVKNFQPHQLQHHQSNLERFYESLLDRQKRADQLLSATQSYIQARFPAGNYRIAEGDASFPCPDTRLDQLAGLLAGSSLPEVPPPPARFLAHNPKVVVQHALKGLTGWMAMGSTQPTNGAGNVTAPFQAADRLSLMLGLLVDGLILLAALASGRSGAGRGLVDELQWLETTPGRLRQRFRQQLAGLLGCQPKQALLQAVKLISRFQVAERTRTSAKLTPAPLVALPQSGSFLVRHPEVDRLGDLLALLESLSAAKRERILKWHQLGGPLPSGLAAIREDEAGLEDEALAIFRLNRETLNDLMREAFSGSDLLPSEEAQKGSREELGYDPV